MPDPARPVEVEPEDAPENGAPARRPRDATKTRTDILAAAGARFARRGYSHVTLKEIADDVGVTPAMVVRYFGSKLALFEEVAKGNELDLPGLGGGDRSAEQLARARAVLQFFEDRAARTAGVALLRSLDLDGGELFRSEIERRISRPWSSELTGPDAEVRLKLVTGLLLGVGLFSLGALTEPDRPPLTPDEVEHMARYLAQMLEVCTEL